MGPSEWISIVGIIVSAYFAWRSARSARESKKAEERADTQVSALVAIADAMKLQAGDTEKKRQQRAEQVSAEERAPWRIERVGGKQAWTLTNGTATPKYAVHVTGPAVLKGRDKVTALISGHDTIRIPGAFRSMQTTDDLEITWHREEDLSDDPHTWQGRLPQ